MPLVSLRNVQLAFGTEPVLDAVTWHLGEGERISLLGRNGAGKSSLLRVIAGQLAPDAGVVERKQGLRVGLLEQELPSSESEALVKQVVFAGVGERPDDPEAARRVDEVLSRLELAPEDRFATLSAGTRRRVLLGRALVDDPDLLLLDEPTNHLDIEAIGWLEDFLVRHTGTVLFVTHDRALLGRLASRVIELELGKLHDFPGSYERFVQRKQAALDATERADRQLDKKLASEEVWVRGGLKARRIRNMGRVRALERLRELRRARRQRVGKARISVQEAKRSGKLVAEAVGVEATYESTPVIRELSTIILRGDKVGVLGPNGCGKTTLLRTLLGEIEPSAGRVRLGTRLEIAYFDQLRQQLDDASSVADNIAHGADHVDVDGGRRHVLGYLGDWLFGPDRAKTPVGVLSGGERNRLLLARLFLKPSNVLVLDEPTNDLDIETLELLEQRLIDYAGTVLVVSHDRSFLDNVVTSTLAYEGDGRFVEYAGGYHDWLAQRGGTEASGQARRSGPRRATSAAAAKPSGAKPKTVGPRRLTFKERRELTALPDRIEQLEEEQVALQEQLSDPAFYQAEAGGSAIAKAKVRLEQLDGELEEAYQRWQALDAIAAESQT